MDVGVITPDMWQGIHRLSLILWLVVPLAIVCGGSLLISLAVIPSLALTNALPSSIEKLRRLLFALGLISGVAALAAALAATLLSANIIGEFWPRWFL